MIVFISLIRVLFPMLLIVSSRWIVTTTTAFATTTIDTLTMLDNISHGYDIQYTVNVTSHFDRNFTISQTASSNSQLLSTLSNSSLSSCRAASTIFNNTLNNSEAYYCTLRDAWDLCHGMNNRNNISSVCVINLPHSATISFDLNQGPLLLKSNQNIIIMGHNTTVQPLSNFQESSISSSFSSKQFIVMLNTSTFSNLSLYNFYITGFGSLDFNDGYKGPGGAISLAGSSTNILLDSMVFSNNQGYQGGAIAITGNRLGAPDRVIIHHSIFDNNHANYDGGSIYLQDITEIIVITNVSIVASSSYKGSGGAIAIHDHHSSHSNASFIHDCRIKDCSSVNANGGGIYIAESTHMTFSNLDFTNNQAARYGGSMNLLKCHDCSVNNVIIQQSQSRYGGSINWESSHDVIGDSIFIDNSKAIAEGGAVRYASITRGELRFLHVQHSSATIGGGLFIYLSDFVDVYDTNLSRLSGMYGSGIGATIGVFLCNHLTFNRFNAQHAVVGSVTTGAGAGVVLSTSTDIALINVALEDMFGGYGGGGMFLYEVMGVMLERVQIKNSTGQIGGGIAIINGVDIKFQDVDIKNSSHAIEGGGIYCLSASNITIVNMTISESIASTSGGAIYLSDVKNGYFHSVSSQNNVVRNGVAGGIYASSLTNVTFDHLLIADCQAYDRGGGMFLTNSLVVTLIRSSVLRCFTNGNGGGLYIDSLNRMLTFSELRILDNEALSSGGGVYFSSNNEHVTWLDRYSYEQLVLLDFSDISMTKTVRSADVSNNGKSNRSVGYDLLYYFDGYMTVTKYCCTSLKLKVENISSSNHSALITKETINYKTELLPGINLAPTLLSNHRTLALVYNSGSRSAQSFSNQAQRNRIRMFVIPSYRYNMTSDEADCQFAYDSAIGSTDSIGRSFVCGNRAGSNGGGIVITQVNFNFIFQYLVVEQNIAKTGNGGGIYMESANARSLILHSKIRANMAGVNGGGLCLGFSHYALLFQNCEFIANKAISGYGGGIYLSVNNGIGELKYGNEVNVTSCVIDKNQASLGGGGLYVGSLNALNIQQESLISNNVVLKANGQGGGILIGDRNQLAIQESSVNVNLVEHGCGGGIAVDKSQSTLFLSEVLVSGNEAHDGGGICIQGETALFFHNSVNISDNNATNVGGGMVMISTPLWQKIPITSLIPMNYDVIFHHNIAKRGSALFLHKISKVSRISAIVSNSVVTKNAMKLHSPSRSLVTTLADASINACRFVNNFALEAGTIYWIYSSQMKESPFSTFSRFTEEIMFEGNNHGYGGNIATQPIAVSAPSSYLVSTYSSSSSVSSGLTLQLKDFYDQTVAIAPSKRSVVYPSISEHSCFHVRRPYLTGRDVVNGVRMISATLDNSLTNNGNLSFLTTTAGDIVFDDLKAFCYPRGKLIVTFTVTNLNPFMDMAGIDQSTTSEIVSSEDITVNPVDESASSFEAYTLQHQIQMNFRSCGLGEQINEDDGSCQECPYGTFSFDPTGNSSCQSCLGKVGVESCRGHQINLLPGYWRRFNASKTVLTCVSGVDSCLGGNFVGNGVCHEGYSGPLCGACQDGYYMSNGICTSCSHKRGQLFSPITIAFMVITTFIVGCFLFIWFRRQQRLHYFTLHPDSEPPKPWLVEIFIEWLKSVFDEILVKIKIVIATYQVIVSTASVFQIKFPVSFMKFINGFDFVNLNFATIIPLGCAYHINFLHRLLVMTITPLVLLFLLFMGLWVEYYLRAYLYFEIDEDERLLYPSAYATEEITKQTLGKKRKIIFGDCKSKYLNYVFYLTYLILPSVTTTIFQLFVCTNVDPMNEDHDSSNDHYLTVDLTISCDNEIYQRWLVYGYVMILVYPVGISLFYFLSLYLHREEIMSRDLDDDIDELLAVVDDPTKHQEQQRLHLSGHHDLYSHQHQSRIAASTKNMSAFFSLSDDINASSDEISKPIPQNEENKDERDSSKSKKAISFGSSFFRFPSSTNKHHHEHQSNTPTSQSHIHNHGEIGTARDRAHATSLPPSRGLFKAPRQMVDHVPATEEFVHKMCKTALRMSFLWQAYKPEYWYWELVETSRRIILTAVLSVVATGSSKQYVLSIFLSFVYIKVYAYFQPYLAYSDYRLAEIGQTQIFLTFFGTTIISQQLVPVSWNIWIGAVMTLVNVSVLFVGFYHEILSYREVDQKINKERSMKFEKLLSSTSAEGSGKVDPLSSLLSKTFLPSSAKKANTNTDKEVSRDVSKHGEEQENDEEEVAGSIVIASSSSDIGNNSDDDDNDHDKGVLQVDSRDILPRSTSSNIGREWFSNPSLTMEDIIYDKKLPEDTSNREMDKIFWML